MPQHFCGAAVGFVETQVVTCRNYMKEVIYDQSERLVGNEFHSQDFFDGCGLGGRKLSASNWRDQRAAQVHRYHYDALDYDGKWMPD